MMTVSPAHYRRLGEEAKAKREAKDRLDRKRREEEAERIEKLERDHFAATGSSLPPGWRPSCSTSVTSLLAKLEARTRTAAERPRCR